MTGADVTRNPAANRPGSSGLPPGRPAEPTAWLVTPGLAMIAVTYGLARFAYGLFVPQLREAFDLSPALLGVIGAGSYAGYCVTIVIALVFTSRVGSRAMTLAAGLMAVAGMGMIAAAPTAWVLAVGILVAGSSSGFASPPMGAAVARAIAADKQGQSNTLINSGTSVGVALSGPAALLAAGQWRIAWAAFATVGVAVLAWNARAMPRRTNGAPGEPGGASGAPPLSWGYLIGGRSAQLFAAAAGLGFASAAYWTFSRDLVVHAGGLTDTGSTLFWAVLGVSGLAGGAAGDLVTRYGLAAALKGSLLTMAVAIALLAAAPGVLALSYLSAALFGSSYIMLTGIILVWSIAVFPECPSAGLGAGFLLIAVGQVAGGPIAGALAGATSLPVAFFAFAGLTALLAAMTPGAQDAQTR